MLSLLRPVNIEIPTTEDQYFITQKMDLSKSSLTNISVQQQKEEYSLKKETFATTSSVTADERSNISDKAIDNDKNKIVNDAEQDEKRSSLIMTNDIKSYDILCGRDKATFNNIGNRRFRVLIGINIPRYEKASTKAEKASVIKYICGIFRNEVGVRFLKKHENEDGYYELNESEARKKVGHALRDMSVARQDVKKRREEMRRNSFRHQAEHGHGTRRMSGMDFDPMIEPLPIDDEANRRTRQEGSSIQQSEEKPARLAGRQSKPSVIPELLTQYLQTQQRQIEHPMSIEEKLLDLQKKQQQLRQQQEELLRQQQYQQELLGQQIRNHRIRNQQERLQQQQQQRPQQKNTKDRLQQIDHNFDFLPRRR